MVAQTKKNPVKTVGRGAVQRVETQYSLKRSIKNQLWSTDVRTKVC